MTTSPLDIEIYECFLIQVFLPGVSAYKTVNFSLFLSDETYFNPFVVKFWSTCNSL